jgi:hypothetical protein
VQYILLITRDADAWNALTPDEEQQVFKEFMAHTAALTDSKEYVSGAPLEDVGTATTVRVRDGERLVVDGPYAETREVLGGYYIVEVPDLDRALDIAADTPSVKRSLGSVEVRPLQSIPGM